MLSGKLLFVFDVFLITSSSVFAWHVNMKVIHAKFNERDIIWIYLCYLWLSSYESLSYFHYTYEAVCCHKESLAWCVSDQRNVVIVKGGDKQLLEMAIRHYKKTLEIIGINPDLFILFFWCVCIYKWEHQTHLLKTVTSLSFHSSSLTLFCMWYQWVKIKIWFFVMLN